MITATASCETDTVKRCAIYIRVSTAMQRMEGWSLAAQESSLTAFAKARGWKVVGIYADEGKSARKRLKGRKEIFRLLEDVKAGQVDVILFKELDRWFRSVSDFYKVQDVLDEYGVSWVSERQPNLGMATKEDRLQVNLLLSVGQNETDSTSDRIKYTNKFLREQRRWTSGARTLPRGYTTDENNRVVINPETAPYTRTLIEHFLQTGSARDAMITANREHPPGLPYNNTLRLLQNEMLCGEYKGDPGFVEKPFMTREDFDRMQGLIKHNARGEQNEFYIFSGLIKCDHCGSTMVGTCTRKDTKKKGVTVYKYYRCHQAKMYDQCDHRKSVREHILEKELLEFVKDAVNDRIAMVQQIQHEQKKRKPKKGNRAQIEKKLKKLKLMYLDDDSDKMSFEDYQKERQKILSQLVEDEPEPQLPELADLEKIRDLFEGDVAELYQTFTPEERREFWRGILTEIRIRDNWIADVDFIE